MMINTLPVLEARASSEIENIVTTADKLFRHLQADGSADPATKEALRYRSALLELKKSDAENFYARYHGAFATVGAKYARLRAMLEAALADEFWEDEGKLPTEHELAAAASMSLGTVQRALREFVHEGRLVRMPGRGTYSVKTKYHFGEPFVNARFVSDDGKSILPIDALVVSRRNLAEQRPWTEALNP